MVPGAGIEPARYQIPQDLKSCASTYSATQANMFTNFENLMAGVTRLELATSCVTGMRSNQLSYTPKFNGGSNRT